MNGITEQSPSASGSWCVFVKLDDTHGVKFYSSEDIRDRAMALQQAAYDVMCGPRVYGKCEMGWLDSWKTPNRWTEIPSMVFGYVTELVTLEPFSEVEYKCTRNKFLLNKISVHDINKRLNIGHTIGGNAVRYDFDPFFI